MSFNTRKVFDEISASKEADIPGVLKIGGTKPGPVLIVSAMTHGNEPSGLAAIHAVHALRDQLQGTVYAVINNLVAGAKYFEAKTFEEKRRCRFDQLNMNRLPEDVLDRRSSSEPSEIRRANELYPLLKDAEGGLDVHSTLLPTTPMLIDIKGRTEDLDRLSDGIPIVMRVTNIVPVQVGYPAGSLYGGIDCDDVPVLEVESGSHEEPAAIRTAVHSAIAFLTKFGALDATEVTETDELQEIHRVIQSVRFPDMSYSLLRVPEMGMEYAEGEILARKDGGGGKSIVANLASHSLFGNDRVKPFDASRLREEMLFLAQSPVRQRPRKLFVPIIDTSMYEQGMEPTISATP